MKSFTFDGQGAGLLGAPGVSPIGPAFDPGNFYDAFGGSGAFGGTGATSAKPATLTTNASPTAGGGVAPAISNPAQPDTSALTSTAADYFTRAILVVLGVVFVASGLWMLGGNKIVERVRGSV